MDQPLRSDEKTPDHSEVQSVERHRTPPPDDDERPEASQEKTLQLTLIVILLSFVSIPDFVVVVVVVGRMTVIQSCHRLKGRAAAFPVVYCIAKVKRRVKSTEKQWRPCTLQRARVDGGTMKTVVALLLLCLCHPGHGDCQVDCLSCNNILPKLLRFNTMVCLTECEGSVSSGFYWDFCRKVLSSQIPSFSGTVRKRSQEEVEGLFPEEDEQVDGGLLLPMALQRFDHVTRGLGADERDVAAGKDSQLNAAYASQNALSLEDDYEEEAGQDEGAADPAARGQGDLGLSLSKRFGGFVKGRHSYRKLISPGRSYQKRYGGFIGIRKSARKWNNQKRFSEFLKQYLGMSARATEFNSVSEDLTQQNEV
ncbi:uncharacterized protein V6R79_003501 [Siganus canaliculatus]